MAAPELPLNSITLNLPLTPAYSDEHAQLTERSVPVTLDLGGGSRTFISDPVSVGTYRDLEVMAQLRFDYDYLRDENKLVIRGNDDRTPDQLRITTFVSGAPDQVLGQEPNLVFHVLPNDLGQNLPHRHMWADHVGRHQDLHGALADVARAANDRLVEGAIDGGLSSVLQIGTPPVVTLDSLDDWKLMFGEPVTPETRTDRVGEVINMQFKVDSTYVGTVTWAGNTNFANVIGSTDDPKVKGFSSWLGLWEDKCNGNSAPTYCTSYNYAGGESDWECTSYFVGGHVITGTTASEMPEGATVYIFPICKKHNNNDNVYMKIKYNSTGVQLKYWVT